MAVGPVRRRERGAAVELEDAATGGVAGSAATPTVMVVLEMVMEGPRGSARRLARRGSAMAYVEKD